MIQPLVKGIFEQISVSIHLISVNNMKSILTIYFDASSLYKVDQSPLADFH